MKKVLETKRLYLRKLRVRGAEFFYSLNLDESVMKYTGEDSFKSIKEAFSFLKNYNYYDKYGLGRWAVIDKKNRRRFRLVWIKIHSKI